MDFNGISELEGPISVDSNKKQRRGSSEGTNRKCLKNIDKMNSKTGITNSVKSKPRIVGLYKNSINSSMIELNLKNGSKNVIRNSLYFFDLIARKISLLHLM